MSSDNPSERTTDHGRIHEVTSGTGLVALLYRLARHRATGLATIGRPTTRPLAIILSRGQLIASARDEGRVLLAALRRLAAEPRLHFRFDGGEALYPAGHRRIPLDGWAFAFFESSLSGSGARRLASALAGLRVSIREDLAPDPSLLDETGRRLLAALTERRRTDELAGLARAPRFRTLAFLFALDALGVLESHGVVARSQISPARTAASRALGVDTSADRVHVKRAYRRLARALHPDLRGDESAETKAALGRKLAIVNRAYRTLSRGEAQ